MPTIKSLLCPVDFSDMSKAVLDYAVFMAQSHQAELKLVHVVDQLHGFDSYKILHMTAIEITHEMERQAKSQLEASANHLMVLYASEQSENGSDGTI